VAHVASSGVADDERRCGIVGPESQPGEHAVLRVADDHAREPARVAVPRVGRGLVTMDAALSPGALSRRLMASYTTHRDGWPLVLR
jgi:hypothetical protein